MIGRLRGTLIERRDLKVVVDCGGVGYVVTVSAHTAMNLPPAGEPVTLRIFTHAQENKIALYGFGTAAERELFDLLITVKNVGPSSAMGILSGGADPAEIARLIAAEETVALTRFKGIGKKTAELLVVELYEKCGFLLATWGASGDLAVSSGTTGSSARRTRPPILDDLVSALTQLGWRAGEVEKVVGDLVVEEGATLESLLRHALRSMPR